MPRSDMIDLTNATESLKRRNDALEQQLRSEGRISSPPPADVAPDFTAAELAALENAILGNRMALAMLDFEGLTPAGIREVFRLAKRGVGR